MPDLAQSLWIGPRLSEMERLSIRSFLACGHEFDLYVYQETEGIPAGARVRDGNEILPADRIVPAHGSYAAFADLFRYKLLLDKGGWWVDTDTVCLRPFDFAAPLVFSSQRNKGRDEANNGIIKAPRGCPPMEFLWDECRRMDPAQIKWGDTGPRLVRRMLDEFALCEAVQPPDAFCPVDFAEWRRLLESGGPDPGKESHAVHLWNEMWRRAGQSKDAVYHPDCLYERLKRRYPAKSGESRNTGAGE